MGESDRKGGDAIATKWLALLNRSTALLKSMIEPCGWQFAVDPEPVLTEYMIGLLVWGRIWIGVEVRLIPGGYGSAVGILVGGYWLGWWKGRD